MMLPGVQSIIKYEGDRLITGTQQDCTPIAERMKAMHNEGFHGSHDFKFAGSLPVVIVEKYCNDNGITFADFMRGSEHIKRLMNDPAVDHFRAWKGKL